MLNDNSKVIIYGICNNVFVNFKHSQKLNKKICKLHISRSSIKRYANYMQVFKVSDDIRLT